MSVATTLPVQLDDLAVARFVVNGYHLLELADVRVHDPIAARLDAMGSNPGDAILEQVPELGVVLAHPLVVGALSSLLGQEYRLESHRHWHCKEPGAAHLHWHQDSVNNRQPGLRRLLGLYYPREVTPEMGPTIIVPSTQYRNAPTDRMATYFNIRGQVPLVVPQGTFAITHYDLWHGTAANTSSVRRHMIKFLFARTNENTRPTWDHDPGLVDRPADWNQKADAADVRNILTFGNPLGVSQSDHYKERVIRQQVWDQLMGTPG